MLGNSFPTTITQKVFQDITARHHPRQGGVEDTSESRSSHGIGGHSDDGGQHTRIMPMNNQPIKEGNMWAWTTGEQCQGGAQASSWKHLSGQEPQMLVSHP